MRIVLFGPTTADRWTSSVSQTVPADDTWRTYVFSDLEADLTQVSGTSTYADLVASVDRTMLRHDPGGPSAGGTVASGLLDIDNVRFFADEIFADSFD